MTLTTLPFVDEHTTEIAADVDRVWSALLDTVDRTFTRPGAAAYARAVGCDPSTAMGPRPLAQGATVPGFRVAGARSPCGSASAELVLEGGHHYAAYSLVFRLDTCGPGLSRLRAETRASFPGRAGGVYRRLVIGTRGHVVLTRRLLSSVRRRAEASPSPASDGPPLQRVELPAGVIEYARTGDGPPVVLLHGLLLDHRLWDQVLPLLPDGFTYLRPVLPLGAHRVPMRAGADLSLGGQVQIIADLLEALDLRDVTLVHSDFGGGLLLAARGLDERIARHVVLPCEAFENFPPGLPGKVAVLAGRLPGGLQLGCRQMRVGWIRRTPLMLGHMVARPLPDALVRVWTEPVLQQPGVRRDLRAYVRSRWDPARLRTDTEAMRGFAGDALVLWSADGRVMPVAHGRQLARLMPRGQYAEVPGARVLAQLDEPVAVAREIGAFLNSTSTRDPS